MKLIGRVLFGALLSFIIFNVLLNKSLLWIIPSIKIPGYFYLPDDISFKTMLAAKSNDSKKIFFLGSSRTAFSIDTRSSTTKNYINLGIVGGSIKDQYELFNNHLKENRSIQMVYIELNPMSFSPRHIELGKDSENLDLFRRSMIDEFDPSIRSLLFKLPLVRSRYTAHEVFQSMTSDFKPMTRDNKFQEDKRNRHLSEYKTFLEENYLGFLGNSYKPAKVNRSHFNRECMTMMRWGLDIDPIEIKTGMKYLEKLLTSLIENKIEFELWHPPSPRVVAQLEEDIFHSYWEQIERLAKKKIIRLKGEEYLNPDKYIDCIHPLEELAVKITNELVKSK